MMGADEKFVRANWEHVRSWVRDLDSYGTDQFNVALFLNEKDARWCDNPFKGWQMDVGKEKEVWKDAAKFTRERMKQITLLTWDLGWAKEHSASDTLCGLIEEKLEDLRKGMKCL